MACHARALVLCWLAIALLISGQQVNQALFAPICPAGVPITACFANPCLLPSARERCPQFTTCKPDYCGGCNARFYNETGDEICIVGMPLP